MSKRILTIEDVKKVIENTKYDYGLKPIEFKISSTYKNGRIAASINRTKSMLSKLEH